MTETTATDTTSYSTTRSRVILRSAENYDIWRIRVSAECWAATRKELFEISQEQVDAFNSEIKTAPTKKDKTGLDYDWVTQIWGILTTSLHDELLLKTRHITKGN